MSYLGNRLLIGSCVILILALLLASKGESQEPALDLGEENSLIVGCDFIRDLIKADNYIMKYCRVREPEEITSNKVKLKLTIKDNYNIKPVKVEVSLRKSLWRVERLVITE